MMFAFLKKEPTLFLLRKMWHFGEKYRRHIVSMWTLSALGNLIWLSVPIVFGVLVNELQAHGLTNIYYISLLIGSLIFISLGGWLCHGPSRVLENITGFKIAAEYKKHLYQGVLSLPLSWHADHDSGDTIDKVNKATTAIYDFSRHTYNIIRIFVRIIGTIAVLLYFNVPMGLLTLALIVISFYVISRFDKILIPQYREINKLENKASAKVFDSLSNITTVKVLGIDVPVLGSIMQSVWAPRSVFFKNKLVSELKWFTGGMIFNFIVVIPLLLYTWVQYNTTGIVMAGTISILYMYLQDLSDVYGTFTSMYDDMTIDKSRLQNVEPIEVIFEAQQKINRNHVGAWQTLAVTGLSFTYDEAKSVGFTNFDITFKRGEKVAIVGESGSGKSTLLKIFHGMYETASAKVSIDEGALLATNFMDIDLESTLVPQEPEVFSASIRENITLLLDFTDEEIRRASDAAMFTDVIEQLPRKIESVVNEKGVNLSGGQKQRLALTRALLFSEDKKIILLDESTSSVDSVNEVKIYRNIFENFRDATIIASIHKMNLLKYFDRIVILDKGAIRNQGTFDELLVRDAEFKKSWDEFVLSHKGEA